MDKESTSTIEPALHYTSDMTLDPPLLHSFHTFCLASVAQLPNCRTPGHSDCRTRLSRLMAVMTPFLHRGDEEALLKIFVSRAGKTDNHCRRSGLAPTPLAASRPSRLPLQGAVLPLVSPSRPFRFLLPCTHRTLPCLCASTSLHCLTKHYIPTSLPESPSALSHHSKAPTEHGKKKKKSGAWFLEETV
ncbi:hypothetical protein E2C01_054092 [Portunus trituberculatus]|uniref:Uncharacterized protein n=1 Tax=Portunus trituberculatus TaxID=210409 RepID=A0A5B7GR05_PORTR|nr:hypothetical protein [Portunus trituberculatus]